jgi:hypothetical protein
MGELGKTGNAGGNDEKSGADSIKVASAKCINAAAINGLLGRMDD